MIPMVEGIAIMINTIIKPASWPQPVVGSSRQTWQIMFKVGKSIMICHNGLTLAIDHGSSTNGRQQNDWEELCSIESVQLWGCKQPCKQGNPTPDITEPYSVMEGSWVVLPQL